MVVSNWGGFRLGWFQTGVVLDWRCFRLGWFQTGVSTHFVGNFLALFPILAHQIPDQSIKMPVSSPLQPFSIQGKVHKLPATLPFLNFSPPRLFHFKLSWLCACLCLTFCSSFASCILTLNVKHPNEITCSNVPASLWWYDMVCLLHSQLYITTIHYSWNPSSQVTLQILNARPNCLLHIFLSNTSCVLCQPRQLHPWSSPSLPPPPHTQYLLQVILWDEFQHVSHNHQKTCISSQLAALIGA